MATITIAVPFGENIDFVVDDAETAQEIIDELDQIAFRIEKNPVNKKNIRPAKMPKSESLQMLLGMRRGDKKSSLEIADEIRRSNRKIT